MTIPGETCPRFAPAAVHFHDKTIRLKKIFEPFPAIVEERNVVFFP
jgi:hypothetical protein